MKGLVESIQSTHSILQIKINSTRYAGFKVDNSTTLRDFHRMQYGSSGRSGEVLRSSSAIGSDACLV